MNSTLAWKIIAAASFALNFFYSILPFHSVLKDPLDFVTAFSPGHLLFIIWWIALFGFQFFYLVYFFTRPNDKDELSRAAAPYFIGFSLLQVVWSSLWLHKMLWFSFFTISVSGLLLTYGYFITKSHSSSTFEYIFIHIPVIAMPYCYSIFIFMWNGAAAFHAHTTWARIVANVLVWEFLFIPCMHLVLFADWAVGLSFAYLTASLAVGQFFTKVFALQWIFATVIASFVGLASAVTFGMKFARNSHGLIEDNERAPLIHD